MAVKIFKTIIDVVVIMTLENLKTAEDGATVGDGANGAGKSQKADGGKDVAVDELPEDDMLMMQCVYDREH